MQKSLQEQIIDIQQKQLQQDKTNEEILLNQAEIIVAQEYNACLLELQSL